MAGVLGRKEALTIKEKTQPRLELGSGRRHHRHP